MCLSKLDPDVKNAYGKAHTGYKVFYMRHGELTATDQGIADAKPVHKWLREEDYRFPEDAGAARYTAAYYGLAYGFGFHIFLTAEGALEWASLCIRIPGVGLVVTKVSFQYPHTWGWQGGFPAVVARKMRIDALI